MRILNDSVYLVWIQDTSGTISSEAPYFFYKEECAQRLTAYHGVHSSGWKRETSCI